MIKILIGVKGTGKTKTLIAQANAAQENTKGNVVCIEKGTKLRYDINYQVRLINTDDYLISDASSLEGLVAGILASNADVTDIFIDSAFKICNYDVIGFGAFLDKLAKVTANLDVNILISASIPEEEATDTIKKYL
ncbi:MAG: hypothetical protein E7645_03515 [Ruminococcaceae bacterium]|nr:hypothetical protein [Oscillospiraceae bacterium]